jgi:hypothetical protein
LIFGQPILEQLLGQLSFPSNILAKIIKKKKWGESNKIMRVGKKCYPKSCLKLDVQISFLMLLNHTNGKNRKLTKNN